MNINIPEEMKNYVLPYNWDVKKVWELKAEIEIVEIDELMFLLKKPFWSRNVNSYTDFDLKPIDVIEGKWLSEKHSERIKKANIDIPLDFISYNNNLWILDGIHRLANQYIKKQKLIKIRKHAPTIKNKIKT